MPKMRMLLVATVVMAVVPACGSPSDETRASSTAGGGKVASLESAAPSPSTAPERPRERLDMTRAEFERLMEPYYRCMQEQGVNVPPAGPDTTGGELGIGSKEDEARFDKAEKVCEPRYMPLPPWELDPANPEARDFAYAVVKCLKAKGVKHVQVGAEGTGVALGGKQNDARSIRDGLEFMDDCERTVAAGTKD